MTHKLLIIGAALTLSACSMHAPSKVSQNRIQVEQENFVEEMDLRDVDGAYIASLGQHYNRHGSGPLYLTVAYDSGHGVSSATREVARLTAALRDEGVERVQGNVLPVADLGAYAKILVSYTAYNALAPKDCSLMSGINTSQIEADPDYKLGCSIDTLFAQQIARPKDLAGSFEGNDTSDGRRHANIIESYRSGERNKPLSGESASE